MLFDNVRQCIFKGWIASGPTGKYFGKKMNLHYYIKYWMNNGDM